MTWFDVLRKQEMIENPERDTRSPTYKITEINAAELNNIINLIESDNVGYHTIREKYMADARSQGLIPRNPDAGNNPDAVYATHTEPYRLKEGFLILIKDITDADYKGNKHLHWYNKVLVPSRLIIAHEKADKNLMEAFSRTRKQGSIDYIDEKIHSLPKEAMDILDKIYKNNKFNNSRLQPFIYSKVVELSKYEMVSPQEVTREEKINPFLKKPNRFKKRTGEDN
tara:strand:+ start:669 stop:1346 length:678 start_codon:yes stop_codon:yes gene_type:complete